MHSAYIRPITDLKNKARELVQEVAESGHSVVITQNGRPKVVVMDVEEHDRLQDALAMLKLLAESVESLKRTGRTHSMAEVRRRATAVLRAAGRQ